MASIFLASSFTDVAWADRLRLACEQHGETIREARSTRTQATVDDEVETLIRDVDVVVALITAAATASNSVESELQRARRLGKPILLVLLDDGPHGFDLTTYSVLDARKMDLDAITNRVLRFVDDHSTVPVGILPRQNAFDGNTEPLPFVGREEELSQLDQHLWSDRLVFVVGSAGIGKTSLVRRYAMTTYRATEWYRYSLPDRSPRPGHIQVVDDLFVEESARTESQLVDWWRKNGGPPTIVTARNRPQGSAAEFPTVILGLITETDAVSFLRGLGVNADVVGSALDLLGRHPLALQMAASFASRRSDADEAMRELVSLDVMLKAASSAQDWSGWYFLRSDDPREISRFEGEFVRANRKLGFKVELGSYEYGSFKRWWHRVMAGRSDELTDKAVRAADVTLRVEAEARAMKDAAEAVLALANAHSASDESIFVNSGVVSASYVDDVTGRRRSITYALNPTQLRTFEAAQSAGVPLPTILDQLGLAASFSLLGQPQPEPGAPPQTLGRPDERSDSAMVILDCDSDVKQHVRERFPHSLRVAIEDNLIEAERLLERAIPAVVILDLGIADPFASSDSCTRSRRADQGRRCMGLMARRRGPINIQPCLIGTVRGRMESIGRYSRWSFSIRCSTRRLLV